MNISAQAVQPSGSAVYGNGDLIRDDNDLTRHVDYIHYNPVKHGLVQRAIDWPHTSIHRYVRLGWLKDDWGAGSEDAAVDFGGPVKFV